MKKPFVCIMLSFTAWATAQNTEIKYVSAISTDTLTAKAQLYPNLLSKGKFTPTVLEQGIKVGERRQEVRMWDKDFSYLGFTDKKGDKRVFQQIPKLDRPRKLFEVMETGKISWYRRYFYYKADAWDSNYTHEDFFVKGDQIINIPVKGRYKKKLRELIADKPEIAREVNRIVSDIDIKEILRKYNEN